MSKIYLLSSKKYKDVENIQIFKINYINKDIDFSKYDFLIVTSKNAIYSVNSFNKNWKKIPCIAIAKMTAKEILKLDGIVEFVGTSGHGDEFAKEIIDKIKGKKVLYLRAKKVVSNLVEILKENSIEVNESIVYETVCNDFVNLKIEKNSTIIFTSPSSVECFFKKFQWNDSLKAVVIGKTTAKYLPNNISYEISAETSIEECIKMAKTIEF